MRVEAYIVSDEKSQRLASVNVGRRAGYDVDCYEDGRLARRFPVASSASALALADAFVRDGFKGPAGHCIPTEITQTSEMVVHHKGVTSRPKRARATAAKQR